MAWIARTCVLCGLAACGTVESTSRSTIMVDGRAYTLETQEISQNGRTYQHTAAVVRQRRVNCRPDSPGDCEAAVREARSQPQRD